jgi:hypothetical protein
VIPVDADGGAAPGPAPTHTLRVEPSSIPVAKEAFYAAAQQVDDLVQYLGTLDTPAWAGDPVSGETAQQFDTGSAGAGDMGKAAALEQLTAYAGQLRASAESLNSAYNHYVAVEGHNAARWKGKPTPA